MGYEAPEITVAEVLAGVSADGNKLNPLTAAEVLAALTDDDTKLDGSLLNSLVPTPFPVFVWDAINGLFKAKAGTWATIDRDWLGVCLSNDATGTVNDEVGIGAFQIMTEAAYTVHIIVRKAAADGIVHFIINNVDVGEIDLYAGSAEDNSILSVSLGTLTVGTKILTLKMASKNGSASDYKIYLQTIGIVKT